MNFLEKKAFVKVARNEEGTTLGSASSYQKVPEILARKLKFRDANPNDVQ